MNKDLSHHMEKQATNSVFFFIQATTIQESSSKQASFSIMVESSSLRKALYASSSVALGVWTFITVNGISGPAFEPIIAACSNPDFQSMDDFVSQTGYHAYNTIVGFKVFDLLVCLITQFLFELRQTYPAGALVWSALVVVGLHMGVLWTVEAGRSNAYGLIRYPIVMALLGQLFGISVTAPLLWLPAFIYGQGDRSCPLTSYRVLGAGLMNIPVFALTAIVFVADTDSGLWTMAAGALGGPILAFLGFAFITDKCKLEATQENSNSTTKMIQTVYQLVMYFGFIAWFVLLCIAHNTYGFSLSALWNDIWVNAGPSVAFMTIDGGILYLSGLQYIAYRGGEKLAAKTFGRTLLIGPAAACCMAMIEIGENEMEEDAKKTE